MKGRRLPPSMKLLKKRYFYDPNTGHFYHRRDTPRGRKNSIAGTHRKDNYFNISIDGKVYLAHHLAWLYHYGTWPEEIDHKDRNRSNNKIDNLRDATRTQNNGNSNGWGHRKKSELPRGVFYHPGDKTRFRAQIVIDYKSRHLGCFDTIEEAQAAYKQAALEHFGEYAE